VMSGFLEKGINKATEIGSARGVLVEGAVGADAVAEGDVEVEVHLPKSEH